MNKAKSDEKESSLIDMKKLIMEFMGTFALTFIGSWSIIYADLNMITRNGVALCHAVALTGFIWLGAGISGAHYNPALTLAMVIIKRFDWTTALFYIMSQFFGALVAGGFIFIQINSQVMDDLKGKSVMGIPTAGKKSYEVSGMWSEVLGTFFLAYVFMATCIDNNPKKVQGVGAIAIGMTLYLSIMSIGELSGSGINPARSLGPAIVAGQLDKNQFIHFLGPLIGAALGAIIYTSIFIDNEEDIKLAESEKKLKSRQSDATQNEQEIEIQ